MDTIEQDIDIAVPVDVAYAQWTQFEDFPRFMKNVKEVRQLDETRLAWTAEVAGTEHTWEAKIVEQEPNRRISWHATEGLQNRGTVTFEPMAGGSSTRVHLELDYEPEGLKEKLGSTIGADSALVNADLERFRELVEERGAPTGEWEGRIESGHVTDSDRLGR
jgi:uncharacterized membrane protein